MNKKMKNLLYQSFDTPLGDTDRQRLGTALDTDENLRNERDAITDIRQNAAALLFEPFRPEFTKQVLARLLSLSHNVTLSPELFYASLLSGFRKLAWAGGLAAAALITIHLLGVDTLSQENAWILSDFSIQELLSLSVF